MQKYLLKLRVKIRIKIKNYNSKIFLNYFKNFNQIILSIFIKLILFAMLRFNIHLVANIKHR